MSLQTWEESEERQDDFLRAIAEERGLYPRDPIVPPSTNGAPPEGTP